MKLSQMNALEKVMDRYGFIYYSKYDAFINGGDEWAEMHISKSGFAIGFRNKKTNEKYQFEMPVKRINY